MKPSRSTQPYRKGPRHPGSPLAAMLAGHATGARNPQDSKRGVAKRHGSLARALSAKARTLRANGH